MYELMAWSLHNGYLYDALYVMHIYIYATKFEDFTTGSHSE